MILNQRERRRQKRQVEAQHQAESHSLIDVSPGGADLLGDVVDQPVITEPKGSELHKIITGVDFGTTYTGVSWISTAGAHEKTIDHVDCIRNWPGPGNETDAQWKTPSRSAYAQENDSETNLTGFMMGPKHKSYSWFKLLLDKTQATKYDDPDLATSKGQGVLEKPSSKSAVDLCADYLQGIAAFAHETLVLRISEDILAATPLDFRFTVPAVWSEKAVDDTYRAAHKAARQARIPFHRDTQFSLILEPEAAAVATLHSLSRGGSEDQIKPGDSVLICDCGGGTVDIVTYEITATKPKLEYKDRVVGTSGKCGSTYVDRQFIKWMESTFKGFYTGLKWVSRGPTSPLMREFEGVKRDAGKSKDPRRYYDMTCVMRDAPDSEHYDADTMSVRIYEEELRQLFAPVVDKILALLQSQDAEKRQYGSVSIKTVIFVGGFGDSVYLNDRIRTWCQPLSIRLICPEHPQAAIVRGAALSGLHNIQPTSRRSRRHYGFAYVTPSFDPLCHKQEDKVQSKWTGLYGAHGNMKWVLAKGSSIDEKTKINLDFTRDIVANEPGRQSLTIYSSPRDEPPSLFKHGGCRKVATFKLDFSGVDLGRFEKRFVGIQTIHRVDIQYRVHFGDRQGILKFSAFVGDVELGNTPVSFEGEDEAVGSAGSDEDEFYRPTCSAQ